MAESELKLEALCPWCGTPNGGTESRCRQCYQELGGAAEADEALAGPSLFDVSRVAAACPACGKTNLLSGKSCFECGQPMRAARRAVEPPASRSARFRRRSLRIGAAGWIKATWLLRLASVLYMFWCVIDTSLWLNHATAPLATQHAAATRFTVHAIFEVVRNMALVAGLWLLTFLHVGRDEADGQA